MDEVIYVECDQENEVTLDAAEIRGEQVEDDYREDDDCAN